MRVSPGKQFGTRECPACACEIPANSNRCPICRYEFPVLSRTQRGMRRWGGVLMILLFLAALLGLARWLAR